MAGVLGRIMASNRMSTLRDSKSIELVAAKEILAEVFRVRLSEVDEMIQNRFETECRKEDGLWPKEFSL